VPAALARTAGIPAPRPGVPDVVAGESSTSDGVVTTELSWNVGFGPRTRAWLLRPADRPGPLPGVLGLHCHAGAKWTGAERLVDRGTAASPAADRLRRAHYGGRAAATELARRGFAVLTHDTFAWGSRRFSLDPPTDRLAQKVAADEARWRELGVDPDPAERYDAAAAHHEDTVAKVAGVLSTSFAGMVAHDDLVALQVLSATAGVDPARLGVFGFSGGGGRAAMLAALDQRVRCCVIACMMATFDAMVPDYVDGHSWLLNTPGIRQIGDWPDLLQPGPGRRYLVQYAEDDHLFPPAGMTAADRLLRDRFSDPSGYTGTFYPGGHRFDAEMQAEAWSYLSSTLEQATPQPTAPHGTAANT
jgi:dienelactone hydrolase